MPDFLDAKAWGLIYYGSEWAIRLVMLVVVPMRRGPAAAKAWLLLILFLPWVGLALYALIGRPHLPRWRMERFARVPQVFSAITARLRAHPNVFQPNVGPDLEGTVKLAQNLGQFPILGGNSAEILVDYDDVFVRLAADIDAAQNHVHLLFYIYADDDATRPITQALCRAAGRGVRCRVLVDALGSKRWLATLLPTLRAAGVEAHVVLPVQWFRRVWGLFGNAGARLDLRNHRKIVVIDGRVAYAGSQNLVDANFKAGITYEDLVVRMVGPTALALQYVFASDWFLETNEVLESADTFPNPELAGTLPIQVLPSGPTFPVETTQRLVVAGIHAARRRVVLTTPYFIPDDALLQALQTAVLRGVEVHLVVSATKDQLLVCLAQESYYESLLECGVQLHLYEGNLLHAKHLSIDDHLALVGSSNLDIRSFVLNAEASVLMYSPEFARQLHAEQLRCFRSCRLLTLAQWRERSGWKRFGQNMARLLSSLL